MDTFIKRENYKGKKANLDSVIYFKTYTSQRAMEKCELLPVFLLASLGITFPTRKVVVKIITIYAKKKKILEAFYCH